jgi:hypothetical protein
MRIRLHIEQRLLLAVTVSLVALVFPALANAQQPAASASPASDQSEEQPSDNAVEKWNLYYQATSIGQYHGTFKSQYSGPFSLQDYPERDTSLTTTLFLGLQLNDNTDLYFDPEIAGGRGFSGVNGLANSSNGELPRVASAEPKPYLLAGAARQRAPKAMRINWPGRSGWIGTPLPWDGSP